MGSACGLPVTVPVMLGRREGRGLVERMVRTVVMGRIVVAMISGDWVEVVAGALVLVSDDGKVWETSEVPEADAEVAAAAVVVLL